MDVVRYGIGLAIGIQELHSLGVLVLNIKPTNFLIDDHDQAVIGDFGIPYLLMGIPLPDSNFAIRLGTPNYMAPEQWEPEVRGPITFDTDTWGFGCSIVEMLTGIQPWFGKSAEEIYQSVVMKQEKPLIPAGLPPAVENVISGCFEYDLRNRPLMADILHAFERLFSFPIDLLTFALKVTDHYISFTSWTITFTSLNQRSKLFAVMYFFSFQVMCGQIYFQICHSLGQVKCPGKHSS